MMATVDLIFGPKLKISQTLNSKNGGAFAKLFAIRSNFWRRVFLFQRGHFLSRKVCFFVLTFCFLVLTLSSAAVSADDLVTRQVVGSDFQTTRDALIEVVEAEGLVVSAVIPFNRMLERTASAFDYSASPYANAEVIQFCSSAVAWLMVTEDPAQLALCPLSIVVYSARTQPDKIALSYRTPGRRTPARVKADDLLRRVAERAADLARLKW